ncbi:PDZ domain-containing protein [bacterium]|nr:PDZ domain-containing protein [bacterium]
MKTLLLLLTLFTAGAFAQEKYIVTNGKVCPVFEIGAMILDDGVSVRVDRVSDHMLAKGYKPADLKIGDVVLMINGKSVKTLDDIENLYKTSEIGATIKLGLKRGEEMLMVSFVKADPATLPKMQKKMVRKNADGTETETTE